MDPESAYLPPSSAEGNFGPEQPAGLTRPGLLRASWIGAKVGIRWASYIAGSFAALILIGSLVLLAFGVGVGLGETQLSALGLVRMLLRPLGLFVACVLWGAILGAVVGLILSLIGRVAPGPRGSAMWARADRPIGRFRRREPASETIEERPSSRWRILWLIGVPVMVLMALGLASGAYLASMGERRLAVAVEAADRDDPYWRLEDLMEHREPVPDGENSALVVAEALSHLPENWPDGPAAAPGQPKPAPSEYTQAYDRLSNVAENARLDR